MSDLRVILVIIDACGIGAMPDAHEYNDLGVSTVSNIADYVHGLNMPVCQKLGLGNITKIKGVSSVFEATGCYGRMASLSKGKDSTVGHWEIAGLVTEKPFPVFPDGFPAELIEKFEKVCGFKTIGNYPASGTEIIDQLGERHLATKELILYTSADSVFQLAAHEDIVPVKQLHHICRIARELLTEEFGVARVIARPFTGEKGKFVRTADRKDFSMKPSGNTVLDLLVKNGLRTLAIGKIWDLFAGCGLSNHIQAASNDGVMLALKTSVEKDHKHNLIFANLVDFDMLWGHRRDTNGFAEGLERFDSLLSEIIPLLRENDLMIITADHGCDPTYKTHTDHTREYVPLLVYGKRVKSNIDLGTRSTFSDIAKTISNYFKLADNFPGNSFLEEISLSN